MKNGEGFIEFDNSTAASSVLENLNKLRKNKQFCDGVIQVSSKVDTHEISCHRAVVASVSPYLFEVFNQRVENNTADRALADHCVLSGDYDIDVFESLVNYAYTSKLEIPKQKVKALYHAAAKLKINAVVKFCGAYLVDNVTAENCLGVRAILTDSYHCHKDPITRLDSFIKQNIGEVLKSSEISSLKHIQVELIQSSWAEMDNTNERHLLEMVLDWLRATETTLEIDRLTEKVHLLYLNRDRTLHDCNDIETGDVRDSELVQDYKRLSKKLHQSNGQGHAKSKSKKGTANNKPAKPKQFLYTRSDSSGSSDDEEFDRDFRIIATTSTSAHSTTGLAIVNGSIVLLSTVRRLNHGETPPDQSPTSPNGQSNSPVLQQMSTLQAMPNPRCGLGVAELNGSLFVCGGYDRVECLKSVEILNLAENRWSKLPDMHSPRGRTDIANLNGLIYAVGGSDGTKDLTACEVFDFEQEKWHSIAPLPFPRSHAGVCAFKGKIYVIGGSNGLRGMTRVDVYDPESNSWSLAAPLTVKRSQPGIVVLKDFIYAVGSGEEWNCSPSVERYSAEENKWIPCAPMQQARRGCGVASLRGRIYAMGGHDGSHSLCSVEVYDPTTNTWSAGPPLTTCRANVGAAVVQGRLFVVGGFNGKTFLNTLETLDCDAEDGEEWTAFVDRNKWTSGSRESSSGISGC
ncbi:influenza virus NS1A-binding protein [Galendromus occidentalis]|uniref:Kelch-like protein diablo n=1 Tax=Galendromus occidentalis TaxID=34638 RepID=A0AAJ7L6B7_9ACAR|nr:influenza virus NS1A-binding protein [Galendromus occidentalis]